jgi:uncharacterized protein YjiS (DUF1127 family)
MSYGMIGDVVAELDALGNSEVRPFPYEACRLVQRDAPQCAALIPDLDAYFSELAGYRSWGRRILSWSEEKVVDVRQRLDMSFGERFPAYRDLQISSPDRSELWKALDTAERTRILLLALLDQLLRDCGVKRSFLSAEGSRE